MALKVVFAGTPAFALPSLKSLFHSSHHIIGVYTQPDRPAGRGKKTRISPIKSFALEHNIPIFQPKNFKSAQSIECFSNLKPDVMIVAAYGLILPKSVLKIPHLGCINIHASLLPRWRGASPIQCAILSGDLKTGITLMQMNEGLDTGDILSTSEIDIAKTDTFGSLHDKLAQLGAETLTDFLPLLEKGHLNPKPQNDRLATHAAKIQKADAKIDWDKPAMYIERQIRAFNPTPIAYTDFKNLVLRIYEAKVVKVSEFTKKPGEIFASQGYPIVMAGDDALQLIKVQLPGKKPINGTDFVNAYLV